MPEPHTTVVFSGGGTGGHLYPALALADALVELRPDVRPWFVGATRGVEARILPERGVDHTLLPVEGLPRGGGLSNLRAIPRLFRSVFQVMDLFRAVRPAATVVTGGYASGPAGIASVLMGIPLVIQEQNSVPGKVVRALSSMSRQVHVAFPEAVDLLPSRSRARCRMSGNPIRPAGAMPREEARARFGLPAGGTVVLVVGGSQGSRALNTALQDAVAAVAEGTAALPEGLRLLWSTGPTHIDAVSAALDAAGNPEWVTAVPYIDDMPAALAAADLALSRAGAMGTAELLCQGLPAILVPLPTAAANHQHHNAVSLHEGGAAELLEESGLSGETLWQAMAGIVADPTRRETMRTAALQRARPDATPTIAADIATLLPPAPTT